MAAATSWEDVYGHILVRVSGFLPCRADRVHMACVNRHWRAAVPPPPLPALPPQLPWIIFPRAEPAAPTFYSPLTGRYHRLCGLPPDVRGARWCGSGDGGWLVLESDAPRAHALYNLNSGERIPLPLGFVFATDYNNVFPLVLQSVTLTGSPSHGPYTVAAIALVDNRPTAALWCPGCDSWFSIGGHLTAMPQDVIFHEDAFFFVMPEEKLIRFGPAHGPNGAVTLRRENLYMRPREDYEEDVAVMLDHGSMKRYLVNSRGRLLMVVRYVDTEADTGMLRVFQLSTSAPAVNGYMRRHTWEELLELRGRMLFLGPGCSRSFEVAQFRGFEESMIYILDETFYDVPPVGDDDTGRGTVGDLIPESWPLGRPLRSNAPPIWWLH